MPELVSNDHLTLHLLNDRRHVRFAPAGPAPALVGSMPWLDGYDAHSRPWRAVIDLGSDAMPVRVSTPLGPAEGLRFSFHVERIAGLGGVLEVLPLPGQPMLAWRVRLTNDSANLVRVNRIRLFDGRVERPVAAPSFFVNGWQSWSFSGALRRGEHQPRTRLGPFTQPLGELGRPALRRDLPFVSDMFGLLSDPSAGWGYLLGSLSQTEQFSQVKASLRRRPRLLLQAEGDRVHLPPGASLHTDWAVLQALVPLPTDPLAEYYAAVGQANQARIPAGTPVGWCSWYYYFQNITEDTFRRNLGVIRDQRNVLPFNLVQLDDGFQAGVGDWFETNDTFPGGLRALSDEVREAGFMPGVWLAPFIAAPTAAVLRDHPDWFVKTRFDGFSNAGFVWHGFNRGMDVTHPGVQAHTRRLIGTAVGDWGFPYLKLDFLYAAALPGRRYDPTVTRAQAMRLGLELIREAAGGATFILGCGCPLGSAIGLVDGMRIGADVAPSWRPKFAGMAGPFVEEPTMPGTRNAIRNTLTRTGMHRRWWLNDPDCLLVRADSEMSYEEVEALATVIALSGGMFLVSDDMAQLDPARRRLAEVLLPVTGDAVTPIDLLETDLPAHLALPPQQGAVGQWRVVSLANWQERPGDQRLALDTLGLDPQQPHHVLDFWQGRYRRVDDGALAESGMAPHSVRLLLVRPVVAGQPQYLGSDLHFSGGREVAEWTPRPDGVDFTLDLGRDGDGHVVVALPATPARISGADLLGDVSPGVWRLAVSVRQRLAVSLRW